MTTIEDLVRAIVRGELAAQPATEAPAKRGRGRPAKGEDAQPAAQAAPATAVDPFAASAVAQAVTLQDVRDALTTLKVATTQDNALGILKAIGGADNLSSLAADKYAAVVAAANAAAIPGTAAAEVDPFETATQVAAPSLEDVKAAVVAAQKRTSTATVQKIVMDNGGSAPTSGGAAGPSLKALPVTKYATVIAQVNALPSTK